MSISSMSVQSTRFSSKPKAKNEIGSQQRHTSAFMDELDRKGAPIHFMLKYHTSESPKGFHFISGYFQENACSRKTKKLANKKFSWKFNVIWGNAQDEHQGAHIIQALGLSQDKKSLFLVQNNYNYLGAELDKYVTELHLLQQNSADEGSKRLRAMYSQKHQKKSQDPSDASSDRNVDTMNSNDFQPKKYGWSFLGTNGVSFFST